MCYRSVNLISAGTSAFPSSSLSSQTYILLYLYSVFHEKEAFVYQSVQRRYAGRSTQSSFSHFLHRLMDREGFCAAGL